MLTTITRTSTRHGNPLTPATLARIRATLRAALNPAIRAGHLTSNPASLAELPPARRPRAVIWTDARIQDWEPDRQPAPGRGLDARPNRRFPQRHHRRPAVRRLPPARTARTTPRRGRPPALVRRRPRHRHRPHLPAAPAILRPPHHRRAQDRRQPAPGRARQHHDLRAAPPPGAPERRATGCPRKLSGNRLYLHYPSSRPPRPRPALPPPPAPH